MWFVRQIYVCVCEMMRKKELKRAENIDVWSESENEREKKSKLTEHFKKHPSCWIQNKERIFENGPEKEF